MMNSASYSSNPLYNMITWDLIKQKDCFAFTLFYFPFFGKL
jgi:hypothetical protein